MVLPVLPEGFGYVRFPAECGISHPDTRYEGVHQVSGLRRVKAATAAQAGVRKQLGFTALE